MAMREGCAHIVKSRLGGDRYCGDECDDTRKPGIIYCNRHAPKYYCYSCINGRYCLNQRERQYPHLCETCVEYVDNNREAFINNNLAFRRGEYCDCFVCRHKIDPQIVEEGYSLDNIESLKSGCVYGKCDPYRSKSTLIINKDCLGMKENTLIIQTMDRMKKSEYQKIKHTLKIGRVIVGDGPGTIYMWGNYDRDWN